MRAIGKKTKENEFGRCIRLPVSREKEVSPCQKELPVSTKRRSIASIAIISLTCLSAFPVFAGEVTVILQNKQFQPAEMKVPKGTSIKFQNDDVVAHNVVGKIGDEKFDLGLMKPGESKSQTFAKPGDAAIACDLHPRMKFTVSVE